MEYQFVKSNEEERIVVYAPKRNELIERIEDLVYNSSLSIDGININGYLEDDVVPIDIQNVVCFYAEDDKTYAVLKDKTYRIKPRLYQLEEKLSKNFIRINKSRIVNRYFIEKFDLSWNGTLLVVMKNGDKDYVSRRQISAVKEKMKIKEKKEENI